jgi:hypothetical protein
VKEREMTGYIPKSYAHETNSLSGQILFCNMWNLLKNAFKIFFLAKHDFANLYLKTRLFLMSYSQKIILTVNVIFTKCVQVLSFFIKSRRILKR